MSSLIEIAHLFPWFFPLAVTLFGACIGSFLNVCIYRIPKNESIVRPGSHCGCGQSIAWYDNLPVFSWFLLRGRARCCRRPFSFRYPAIEMLTAALFLLCWIQFTPAKAVAGMILCAIVICAWFIDLDHLIIPDVFTIGGAATGLILSLAVPSLHGHSHPLFAIASLQAVRSATMGLLIGSALVLWVALFAEAILRKEAMGFGDVKYLGALGAFIGWQGAVFSLFGGALLGCVWLVGTYLWKKISGSAPALGLPATSATGQPAEITLGVHVPFGPMLGVAALIYFFSAHHWVNAYFDHLAFLF